jgi:NTE family protein
MLLMGRALIWITFATLAMQSPARAGADGTLPDAGARPKVGLALSGGGARGAAHIGVLKVLEERRIPVDYIAGTSMGAIVGGLYASGMSVQELETLVTHIDWADAFDDWIPREDRSFRRKRDDDLYLVKNKPGISGITLKFPPGILDGQKIDVLLKRHSLPVVAVRDFDDLAIPFRAVATDLVTGETVVIDRGDLALAMRASMSIPVVFAPREVEGRFLADGGVSCNLPIDVVRRMGAEVVIAVDISTPLQKREQLQSVLAITDQLTGIMTRRNADEQIASLGEGDVFIHPDLGGITTASFNRAGEAIPIGTAAAEAVVDELDRFSVSPDEYEAYLRARARPEPRIVIDEVRVVNRSRLADGAIAERLHVETGKPLDVDRLQEDLDQIYGLELFESVYYDISDESGRTVLTVTARERAWGPNYLQFGAEIYEDFEGPNFNLSIAYTRTAIDRLNGEWRTALQIGQEPGVSTNLYQPLERSLHYFLDLGISVDEWSENVFDSSGNKLSELGLRRIGTGCAVGREMGTWGELRSGIVRDAGEIRTQVGDPGAPRVDFNTGELFLQFSVDRLDDFNFPRSGGTLRMRAVAGLEELGSDGEYEQGIIEWSLAGTVGRNTGLVRGYLATTRDSDAPFQSLFRLGGFRRLSGLELNELKGQHAALVSGSFYRRIWGSSLAACYAGMSLEYGNVFQDRDNIGIGDGLAAGSVFLGLNTLVGPVYLAYGRAERDRGNFYFFLGRAL